MQMPLHGSSSCPVFHSQTLDYCDHAMLALKHIHSWRTLLPQLCITHQFWSAFSRPFITPFCITQQCLACLQQGTRRLCSSCALLNPRIPLNRLALSAEPMLLLPSQVQHLHMFLIWCFIHTSCRRQRYCTDKNGSCSAAIKSKDASAARTGSNAGTVTFCQGKLLERPARYSMDSCRDEDILSKPVHWPWSSHIEAYS